MIQAISFRGDRSPVPPRVKIGFESDNLVESLAFELPELADDQSAMLMINGNAYANMIDLYRTEDGKWAVDLTAEMVGPAGVYESYVAINCPDGRRWNSGVFYLLTGDLPAVSGATETLLPPAVEHVLQEMAETRQEMAASVTATEDAAQRAEDAAQRAENAANQGGGGSTAPAKDAVLYTVQELTEEQQAQARDNIGAASVETVRQLSEDKADRSEIPEPYVLPTASADTLGGVKVGNGLTADEDGRVSVEPDGEYEPIKEITIEEDVTQMVIPLELDGQPCDFTAVALKIITEPTGESEANTHHFITLGDKPDYSKTVLRFVEMYHTTYARYIACKIKVEGGKVWGTTVASTNNSWNQGSVMTSASQNGLVYAEKINALSVICVNSRIRKGTVITIEGVRAR